MSYVITFDQNSNCIMVFLGDNTKTDGSGKTGLTYNTSGLIIATRADNEASATVYKQADGNIEDISTLGTFAAPTSGKCRFKKVDATNMPGIYEIQLPDARFSVASARDMVIMVSGGGVVPTPMHIPLFSTDLYTNINGIVTAIKAKTDPWPSIVYP